MVNPRKISEIRRADAARARVSVARAADSCHIFKAREAETGGKTEMSACNNIVTCLEKWEQLRALRPCLQHEYSPLPKFLFG